MANTPKKQENSNDTLAALEDALSINEHKSTDHGAGGNRRGRGKRLARDHASAAQPGRSHFRRAPSAPVSRRTRTPKGAANDDRQFLVGQIRKHAPQPPTMPYVIAGVASIAWATAQFLHAHARFAQESRR